MMYNTLTREAEISDAGEMTGLLYADEMPEVPDENSTDFLMYNPGTQTCDTLIQIGGSGEDITIENATNGTKCVLNSLPSEGYLEIDSRLGVVNWVHGDQKDKFFEYHNEGYMTLASYLPRANNVDASYTSGSATVTCHSYYVSENIIGQYILLDGAWHKIVSIDEENNTLDVADTLSDSGAEYTKIVTMNEISITGTTVNLNKLVIDYFPVIV